MWNEQKRSRFRHLQQCQQEQALSKADEIELALLVKELEAAEAAYLAPATEQLHQEREAIEAQNRRMEALVHRQENLERRLREFLNDAQAERQAIKRELASVLTRNGIPKADD
jgi:hypothetical protein